MLPSELLLFWALISPFGPIISVDTISFNWCFGWVNGAIRYHKFAEILVVYGFCQRRTKTAP
tara:strand:+ start:323 stop:508 length:186 start_codon:yes stop_codon:yes gene_type:complete